MSDILLGFFCCVSRKCSIYYFPMFSSPALGSFLSSRQWDFMDFWHSFSICLSSSLQHFLLQYSALYMLQKKNRKNSNFCPLHSSENSGLHLGSPFLSSHMETVSRQYSGGNGRSHLAFFPSCIAY